MATFAWTERQHDVLAASGGIGGAKFALLDVRAEFEITSRSTKQTDDTGRGERKG